MTRRMLSLSGGVLLLWMLLICISMATGRLMATARTAVFTFYDGDTTSVVLVDVWQGTRARGFTDFLSDNKGAECYRRVTGQHPYYRNAYDDGYQSWLPDRRRILVKYDDDSQQTLYEILDTLTGASVPVNIPKDDVLFMSWSPDSRYGVIYGYDSEIILVETATGALTQVKAMPYPTLAWSPNSRYVALMDTSTADIQITLLDTADMTEKTYHVGGIADSTAIAWTQDNQLRFFAPLDRDKFRQLYLWSPDRDVPKAAYLTLPSTFLYASQSIKVWSPDATKFFYEAEETAAHILDARTGVELAQMPAYPDQNVFRKYTWSPDSRYLLAYNDDAYQTIAVTDTVTGQNTYLTITPDDYWGNLYTPHWLSDTELEIYQISQDTLGRVVLHDGIAEFIRDYRIPGAFRAAYCNPETAA